MIGKLQKTLNLVSNMGWRYIGFRSYHEIMRRTGMLKRQFPTAPAHTTYITLQQWKDDPAKFFFADKESISFPKQTEQETKERFELIKSGKLLMFNSFVANLGTNYDWVTNPDNGYKYDIQKHWTEIPDMSKEAGDIKYVWEKSRFSYLYDIIRYDYHFNQNCADMVFGDILSWIEANPINCGPNYRCSQEMSLRVLNWTFALYYYRNSSALTESLFDKIQFAIYWHLHHIYNNIQFSRIAVRNNHAITETLTLYIGGMLYPNMPGAAQWKEKGKKWFEQEICYQVYEDGTFLQFSMNYHRIVAQLLTWAITIADVNKERFVDEVYKRAKRTFIFLRTCMVDENGHLPNYGANDGALFFKLSNADYRDYRPQLQALAAVIGTEAMFTQHNEDSLWYGVYENARKTYKPALGMHTFAQGGYYIIREQDTLTFIKCGGYKDRPSQADNLHLDIWYKGDNILVDAGSYKYNTDDNTLKYFMGTASHNTVMVNGQDQMMKGGRFIWYYWSTLVKASLTEDNEKYTFKGTIGAFAHVQKDINHTRIIIKSKNSPHWQILDEVTPLPAQAKIEQLWHSLPSNKGQLTITPTTTVKQSTKEGQYSSKYGTKTASKTTILTSETGHIHTNISIKP